MPQMLYAYCIICKNYRITCSNQLNNAKRIVVASNRNDCVLQNLRDVYGSKGVDKLLVFEQCRPDERVLNEFDIKNAPEMSDVRYEGFVSSCQQALGRNLCDRQLYYVNGRPFDARKWSMKHTTVQ
uniref:Uncharacterized protein n=1 Tax=Strigamia maritima TaxID=126957 RepID=T1J2L6_STRMM